jgi:hypothetical protein
MRRICADEVYVSDGALKLVCNRSQSYRESTISTDISGVSA